MKKFTLSIVLAGILGNPAFSQDLKPSSILSPNSGRTVNVNRGHHSQQLAARGGAPSINVAYSDDFNTSNDTNSLKLRGYIPYYRGGGPQGLSATWYQGAGTAVTPPTFAAYNGADTDYVAANYNVVTGTNDINSWLVLPALNISAGDIMSFYSQSITGSTYPDSIKVMYSAVGDSTPEDLSWVQLDSFVVNTLGNWELKTFTAPASGATARFAIRYAVVNGGPTGANSNYIGIDQLDVFTPASIDGGVSAVTAIAPNCAGLSATEAITVTINNYGSGAISNFPVSYTINGGTPVTETYTGTINGGASASYTFTTTANLSAVGAYVINAYTTITSDVNASNDASNTTALSGGTPITLATPFSEGFETAGGTATAPILPLGWTEEDVDGDLNDWDFPITYPHNGTHCARIGFGGGAAAPTVENWLYTPCLNLTAGTNYAIEYFYKTFTGAATAYQLETRFGSAAASASMTTSIAIEPTPTDSSYHYATHPFTVPSNGTYYIGFNGFGTGVTESLRVDDGLISVITGVNTPTVENAVSVFPNPSSVIITIKNKLDDKKLNIIVSNSLGQIVYTTVYSHATKEDVDLSKFGKGVYSVQIKSEKGIAVKKVVIE